MKITKSGLYPDLTDSDYRNQHEWLSVSGIKKLLPPSCPAKYRASVGTEEHKPQFDFGKAFHAKVLGDGAAVEVFDGDSGRSAAARAFRDDCYSRGVVPLLPSEAAVVDDMAAAVQAHNIAPHLFTGGAPEVSAFWVDEATGVQCKARFDYLPEKQPDRRLLVPDLKSAASADPGEFSRAAGRFLYVMQQEHYCSGLRHLGIDADPVFLFVVCEKDPPYLPAVLQFSNPDDIKATTAALDKALRIYSECAATDTWPGYPGVTQLTLPPWHLNALEEIPA